MGFSQDKKIKPSTSAAIATRSCNFSLMIFSFENLFMLSPLTEVFCGKEITLL